MWEGSCTEGGNVPKQVSLGWMWELAEQETVTKQESKPWDNVCPCFLPSVVASGSILSSPNDGLWLDRTMYNTPFITWDGFDQRIRSEQQSNKVEQQQQQWYQKMILQLDRIYVPFWRAMENTRIKDGKSTWSLTVALIGSGRLECWQ